MSTSTHRILFTGQDQVEIAHETISAPAPHEIQVRTRKSLISTGTECIVLGRKYAPGSHWDNWVKSQLDGFAPGYLNAGEVVALGAGVEGFQIGDRVACRAGHRQLFNVAAARALPIPNGVSDEEAAWFGLAKITQIGVRRANHKLGDAVVLIGLGLLGQLVTQYARLSGAREVIAIDTAPKRLEMAKAHGATHTLEMGVGDAAEAVRDITEGRGADVVYDITGHPTVFAPALGLARRFGTLLLLGDTGTPGEQRLTSDVVTRGVQIVGAHDGFDTPQVTDTDFWTEHNMERLFFNYVARGQMNVADLITNRFPALEAAQAYHLLQTDRSNVMGVILDWDRL